MKPLIIPVLLLGALVSCKKSNNPLSPTPQNSCRLIKETTSLTGNEATLEYTYDNAGNLLKRRRINVYGQVRDSLVVNTSQVTIYHADGATVRTDYLGYSGNEPVNLAATLPGRGRVYVKLAGPGAVATLYCDYIFSYDAKNRLKQVDMDYAAAGAYDFILRIDYDDKDNVTHLNYERTTGPRDPIPTYVCTRYDDKSSPASIHKNWAFFVGQTWNYPETIFADLSKHNPYAYAYALDNIAKTYQYNDKGIAITETNNVTTNTRQYTYVRTFTYSCP